MRSRGPGVQLPHVIALDARLSEHPSAGRDLRISGAVAAISSLAVLWAASQLWTGVPFAPAGIADAVVRLTPGDASTFLIESLGAWAMRLLGAAVVLGTALVGGEVLRRTATAGRPRRWVAASTCAGAAAIAAIPLSSEVSWPSYAVAVVAAAACYAYIAKWVHHRLWDTRSEPDEQRRYLLRLGAVTATGIVVGGASVGWLARRFGGPDTDITLVAPASPARPPVRESFPNIPGLSPEITSVDDHYVVDIDLFDPSVEATGWELQVTGLVERPLRLDLTTLQNNFEVVEEYSVMTCISNEVGGGLVGNSAWGGVRLAEVLEEAGVREGAVDVVLRAADRYSDSIPLDVAMQPGTLLAVSQNGAPLTQEHGFPCRLRVPSIYGMKNVKWLTSIEIVDRDYEGYWMVRGWSDEAVVKTESRIDVAGADGSATVGKETWIAGVAWAGSRGVSKVEVSTDSGATWRIATLKEPLADNAWRLWALRWTPERRGATRLLCRATDGEGEVQTKRTAEPHPDGASGYHAVEVEVS